MKEWIYGKNTIREALENGRIQDTVYVQEGSRDEKIIAIPFSDPTYSGFHDLMDLPSHIFDEMAHFFTVYKSLEGKQATAGDVNDRKAAIAIIQEAIDHYQACFGQAPAPLEGERT